MNSERGWTTSEHDLRVIWFLDWLYDFQAQHRGRIPPVRDFNGDDQPFVLADDDLRRVFATVDTLAYVDGYGALDDVLNMPVSLKPEAIEIVRLRRERRTNAAARSRACRDAVVSWLYDQRSKSDDTPNISGFVIDPRGFFEGQALATKDVADATTYLRDRGLITGSGSWQAGILRPSLTADGLDCAEHYDADVHSYLTRNQSPGGPTYTNTFNDAQNVNVAQGNRDVQQSITSTEIDVQALLDFVRPVRDALPALGLDAADQARVREYTDEIEVEAAKPQPDHRRLKQLGGGVLGIVKKATAAALTAALLKYAPDTIHALSSIDI